jgi:hypothetical protein
LRRYALAKLYHYRGRDFERTFFLAMRLVVFPFLRLTAAVAKLRPLVFLLAPDFLLKARSQFSEYLLFEPLCKIVMSP